MYTYLSMLCVYVCIYAYKIMCIYYNSFYGVLSSFVFSHRVRSGIMKNCSNLKE